MRKPNAQQNNAHQLTTVELECAKNELTKTATQQKSAAAIYEKQFAQQKSCRRKLL